MNILIPIDESEYSKAALEAVLTRPWPEGTCFKVITVLEPFHPEAAGWQTSYVPLAIEAQKTQLDMAQKLVDDAQNSLRERFHTDMVSGEVIEGYIKDKILDAAAHWPANLIMLGSHGRRGISRMLLGSVSEAIARHAHCSVEIVKIPHDPAKDGHPA
jgi:nucleotide-binding universal stress UspA family protein